MKIEIAVPTYVATTTDPAGQIPGAGVYQVIEVAFEAPPLTGSAKQIAWATDLRASALHALLRSVTCSPGRALRFLEQRATFVPRVESVLAKASASKTWIDNRDFVSVCRALGVKP